MLKDITLGQYFPGNSVVHRLDPRTKLVLLVFYIVALFVASGWIAYGVCFLFLALAISVSHIPLKAIFRGMKPLVFILIFTGVRNVFFPPGTEIRSRGSLRHTRSRLAQPGNMEPWMCGAYR